jgi:hypothetical protein
MAPQQTLSLKRLAHHHHLEVAFGARCHPVHVALIDHFQVAGGERGSQLGLYLLLHAHGKTPEYPAIVARVVPDASGTKDPLALAAPDW